jgi:SAM-dependent methyltransferase
MEFLRNKLLNRLKPIHRRMRDQKIDLFLRFAGDLPMRGRLLDVGGGTGIDGEFLRLYNSFADVVIVNLDTSAFEGLKGTHIRSVNADGCALPFESRSFEWVFSNAVIEHVGDFASQRRFAEEIRRVAATGYFVTTPNRHFPIEPHTFLPFYQYLQPRQQRFFVRLSPGYMREQHQINLLSGHDLHVLFPEARVRKIGFRVFPNNLVAMHKVQPRFLGRNSGTSARKSAVQAHT